ncbi:MAG: type I-E CRISPR-associated protein Cse1/CasA, partial [Candidatus Aegiribacteria sp.]|nr:type I-E CRISPR-associated protein Cse1/CasA [Candidatus Aegiribacteria sp.]
MDGFMKHNLLDEPIISIGNSGKHEAVNLPKLLELLGEHGNKLVFTHLRPFQEHAWHAFLVQLASMALISANEDDPIKEAVEWREILLKLTDGDQQPWCLYVEDLTKPAFMQPPIPEGNISRKWKTISSPGMLDLLVTAKNHDVKAQLISNPAPDHWCFALVSLQTMEGFLGAGNYGIVRMNGGFASRPCVALAKKRDYTSRFLREVPILIRQYRSYFTGSLPYRNHDGFKLLWLLPWDGKESIDLGDCDPYFIEICRRVRLQFENGTLHARAIASKTSRIAGGDLHGVTGDPWTPVDRKEAKALTVSSAGFDFRKLH